MSRKSKFTISFISLFIFLCLWFGRSIYMPKWYQIIGKSDTDDVVKTLQRSVAQRLESHLRLAGFSDFPNEIVLVGFKEEQMLEVYGVLNERFSLIKKYPFTAMSGSLGPKLKEGDRQIPEGIYEVEYLNPNSSYHLSLKVSYPNAFDKKKTQFSDVSEMGGDIFIHGKKVTIGCIPIGDDSIEEVFFLAEKALDKGIKVILSPRDFRVNDEYPLITSVDWEIELYDIIKSHLNILSK